MLNNEFEKKIRTMSPRDPTLGLAGGPNDDPSTGLIMGRYVVVPHDPTLGLAGGPNDDPATGLIMGRCPPATPLWG